MYKNNDMCTWLGMYIIYYMIHCARFAKVRQSGHHGMVGSTLAQ